MSPWERIAAAMPGYERRPQQERMADAVRNAIAGRRHLVVEAGTGVGKSFAYLVPAIEAAKRDKNLVVVVATRTIALQEQLLSKDLPFLLKALGAEALPVALAKGRNNYVCRRRAEIALVEEAPRLFDDGKREQLAAIVDWARKNDHDGSRSSMKTQVENDVWRLTRAEKGNCLGKRCPFYDECAYQASRHAIRSAKIIIANHTLVFLDIGLRRVGARFLPDYDVLVLDEAHEADGVATDAIGEELSPGKVERLLSLLSPARGSGGLFGRLHARKDRGTLPASASRAVDDARSAAEEFWKGVGTFRPEWIPDRRLLREKEFDDPLSPALRDIHLEMGSFAASDDDFERVCESCGGEDERGPDRPAKCRRCGGAIRTADENLAIEWYARMNDISDVIASIDLFRRVEKRDRYVYWVDSSTKGRPVLHMAPLSVAPILRESLFAPTTGNVSLDDDTGEPGKKRFAPAVVLASATLRVGGRFAHVRESLGIDEADELDAGSPFDFERQCLLALFPNLPEPKDPAFEEQAILRMHDLVLETKGGAFLLFASHGALGRAHERLEPGFRHAGLLVLRQGERPPSEIAQAFRENRNCVLFGAATFWQGIDIRGDNLRLVVIHKIPFPVPTDPLEKARAEAIEKMGRSSFAALAVPAAAIALKQGFGRLIRSKDDRGVVAILDPRMRTKAYGKTLLASLPHCRTEDVG